MENKIQQVKLNMEATLNAFNSLCWASAKLDKDIYHQFSEVRDSFLATYQEVYRELIAMSILEEEAL